MTRDPSVLSASVCSGTYAIRFSSLPAHSSSKISRLPDVLSPLFAPRAAKSRVTGQNSDLQTDNLST